MDAHILLKGRLAEHLLAVADLIERTGWCRYQPYEENEQGQKTAFCALGAHGFLNNTYTREEDRITLDVLTDALSAARVLHGRQISSWNDHAVGAHQVISGFREAARVVIEST